MLPKVNFVGQLPFEEQLRYAERALVGGQRSLQVMEGLASEGFDTAKWEEGHAAYATAAATIPAVAAAAQQERRLYPERHKWRRRAMYCYQQLLDVLLPLFGHDEELRSAYRIAAPRPRSETALYVMGLSMVAEIEEDPAVMAELARRGYSAAEKEIARAVFFAYSTVGSAYTTAANDHGTALRRRDSAFMQLRFWLRNFYRASRSALPGEHDLLESLGAPTRHCERQVADAIRFSSAFEDDEDEEELDAAAQAAAEEAEEEAELAYVLEDSPDEEGFEVDDFDTGPLEFV